MANLPIGETNLRHFLPVFVSEIERRPCDDAPKRGAENLRPLEKKSGSAELFTTLSVRIERKRHGSSQNDGVKGDSETTKLKVS